MESRFLRIALYALVFSGCAAAPETEVIVEREYIACPESIPPGKCPACIVPPQPRTLIESMAATAACAEVADECRKWHDKRDVGHEECARKFGAKSR